MTAAAVTDTMLAPVFDYVARATGLVFGPAQAAGACDRIREGMERTAQPDVSTYVDRLGSDTLALDDLVADLTVGETYFFRDATVYRYLREKFLPRIALTRAKDHVLRAWSAGCASGEEAYSVAMMLVDAGWGGRCAVMGTDISRAALVKARRATYGEWSFRGGDRSYMHRHFTSMGSTFTLGAAVRAHTSFQYHNLALDGCPSLAAGMCGVDLILCRNVLMYLDPAILGRIAVQFREVLIEGGVVITGTLDPPLEGLVEFSEAPFEEGRVYGRRSPPPAAPAVARKPAAPAGSPVAEDAASFALRVRALALAAGPVVAEREAQRGMALFPVSVELAFLLAILPAVTGSYAQAAAAARRALYLDRFQPAFHFVLATSLWNCGDLEGARRGFRNARDLAAARPGAEPVPFAEGETAGRVAAGAAAQLAMVDVEGGVRA